MKLKIGDTVYLQKFDVAYLLHHLGSFDPGIVKEIFRDDDGELGAFWMNGGPDGLSFEIAFKEPKNIEWLMAQDYIFDFETFSEMSIEELEKMRNEEDSRDKKACDDFNSMSLDYRKEHYDERKELSKKSAAKQLSYDFMIAYKKGEREFKFPKGYIPKIRPASKTKEAKKPGIITRLFSHKNRNVQ